MERRSTVYISCRYTNCCRGSSQSTPSFSRSNRNAYAAPIICTASIPSQGSTARTGS